MWWIKKHTIRMMSLRRLTMSFKAKQGSFPPFQQKRGSRMWKTRRAPASSTAVRRTVLYERRGIMLSVRVISAMVAGTFRGRSGNGCPDCRRSHVLAVIISHAGARNRSHVPVREIVRTHRCMKSFASTEARTGTRNRSHTLALSHAPAAANTSGSTRRR